MSDNKIDRSVKLEISRNDLTPEIVEAIHSRLLKRLAEQEANISANEFSRSSFSRNGFGRSGFSKGVF